jgi:transposase
MANTLKMERQTLIKQLLKLGWSYRRIEKETGIRHETVSKYDPNHPRYHDNSKAAKVPTESNASGSENRPKCPPTKNTKDEPNTTLTLPSNTVKPTRISKALPYDNIIRDKLALGLSAQRIYQDLVCEHEFEHGYDCIKRYVRKLKKKNPKVFARMHCNPGEEAQVDFGKGAPTLKNGRYVRPWFFKMVLSHSRHSYEECVWTQDVETFIQCHEHAFEAFGGVPAIVRVDNLKSAVLEVNLFEPELNPLFAAFAKHYNFSILPCLPRKPEHKGKTESGVGYTKDNALKGLKFNSIKEQNDHLRFWNKRWARTRIHGTMKRQVWAVFINEEKQALKPLPKEYFQFFKIGSRKVHNDGHIEVNRAYYSVPHRLVGKQLDVHFNCKWVKAFDKNELVAFHRTIQTGHFQTNKKHIPDQFCLTTEEYKTKLLNRCSEIGRHCKWWALKVIKERNQLGFRAIQGVLRLNHKYTTEAINLACAQAVVLGSYRFHTVKLLCENQNDPEKQVDSQLELLQNHDLIRNPKEYQNYFERLQNFNSL